MFSLCLSVHLGDPAQDRERVPPTPSPQPGPRQGTPYSIPPARTRTGCPPPLSHPPARTRTGYPHPAPTPLPWPEPGQGTCPPPPWLPPSQPGYSPLCLCPVPLARTRAGYPPPPVGMPQTGYDAGGTPLAFSRRRTFLFKLIPSFKKLDTASCVYTITDETFKLFIGVAIYFILRSMCMWHCRIQVE